MIINLIKSVFTFLGIDIYRLSASNNNLFQLKKFIDYFNIQLIYDIGANSGQFGSEIYKLNYKGSIVSFEPLSIPYNKLKKKSGNNSNWHVHERCAIGSSLGNTTINISRNSVSSSILNIEKKHLNAAPQSLYIDQEVIKIITLDSIYKDYYHDSKINFMIKIDVQGYEWNVLEGSKSALIDCAAVICELSLVKLYDEQKLWDEIILYFKKFDLELYSIQRGFTDNITGQTLQIDGIFIKSSFL